jgi:pilus assembly protein Flp/PilA
MWQEKTLPLPGKTQSRANRQDRVHLSPAPSRVKGGPRMTELFQRFQKDESGATAIEYGLIAAVLSVIIVGGSGSIKQALHDTFMSASDKIAEVNGD